MLIINRVVLRISFFKSFDSLKPIREGNSSPEKN